MHVSYDMQMVETESKTTGKLKLKRDKKSGTRTYTTHTVYRKAKDTVETECPCRSPPQGQDQEGLTADIQICT